MRIFAPRFLRLNHIDFNKMNSKIKKSAAICFLAAVFLLLYGLFEARWIRISRLSLSSPDVPEQFLGKKIVFASDFHCGIISNQNRISQIVETINGLDPDIVILGGDYIDGSERYIEPCFKALAGLKADYGVFGVLGNHDYRVGEGAVKEAMEKASIFVIDNDARWVSIGGQKIKIGGVGDFLAANAVLKPTVQDTAEDDFVILVAHNPSYYDRIFPKIDLVLSGHTHGGQITIFGLWKPFFELKYQSKYISGAYPSKNSLLLVSNGVGTTILPIRFFARPEISLITLQKPDGSR